MDDLTPAAADATPAPAPTVSAEMDAATKGDFSAFQRASDAKRTGKPLDSVAAEANAPVAAAPETPKADASAVTTDTPAATSKRQQAINESIRVATEKAVADARAQWEADARRGQPPSEPAKPTTPAEPAWKRFATMPESPKLADFDSVEEHTAAMSYFIAEKMFAEQSARAASEHVESELTAAQTQRAESFQKQINAAKADPEFVNKLTPEVRALKPFDALLPGETPGPANVIAEQVFDSPVVDKVLIALAANGNAELTRLMRAPAHILAMPATVRAAQHIKWIVKEFGKLEARLESPSTTPTAPASPATPANPLSSAPAPFETLKPGDTSDPAKSALARGDFGSFHVTETQKRIASRQGR